MQILVVDIGGTHVKLKHSDSPEIRKFDSGDGFTPQQVVAGIKQHTAGWTYDAATIGVPGPVVRGTAFEEPWNLGTGWVGLDWAVALGGSVRVVNDALMQAVGSYEGGRMLFLGLGTGLGAAMIVENVAQPMELAHLPYKKDRSFEDYVGERGLERRGLEKWRKSVFDVVGRLRAAMEPDYVVIGGGNVEKLDELPPDCRRGDNQRAFEGGFRLWQNKSLRF